MGAPSGDPSSPDFNIDLCSFDINCPIETSFYGYVPNLGINVFFAGVYGLVIISCFFFLIFRWPAWRGYTIALGLGSVLSSPDSFFVPTAPPTRGRFNRSPTSLYS